MPSWRRSRNARAGDRRSRLANGVVQHCRAAIRVDALTVAVRGAHLDARAPRALHRRRRRRPSRARQASRAHARGVAPRVVGSRARASRAPARAARAPGIPPRRCRARRWPTPTGDDGRGVPLAHRRARARARAAQRPELARADDKIFGGARSSPAKVGALGDRGRRREHAMLLARARHASSVGCGAGGAADRRPRPPTSSTAPSPARARRPGPRRRRRRLPRRRRRAGDAARALDRALLSPRARLRRQNSRRGPPPSRIRAILQRRSCAHLAIRYTLRARAQRTGVSPALRLRRRRLPPRMPAAPRLASLALRPRRRRARRRRWAASRRRPLAALAHRLRALALASWAGPGAERRSAARSWPAAGRKPWRRSPPRRRHHPPGETFKRRRRDGAATMLCELLFNSFKEMGFTVA